MIAELKASADLLLCDGDVAIDCCSILADILNVARVDRGTMGFGAYLFGYPDVLRYATLEVLQLQLESQQKRVIYTPSVTSLQTTS